MPLSASFCECVRTILQVDFTAIFLTSLGLAKSVACLNYLFHLQEPSSSCKLCSVDGEVLKISSEAAIHAALLYSSQSIIFYFFAWINALIEAIYAQLAVLACSPRESSCFECRCSQWSIKSHAKIVTHTCSGRLWMLLSAFRQ